MRWVELVTEQDTGMAVLTSFKEFVINTESTVDLTILYRFISTASMVNKIRFSDSSSPDLVIISYHPPTHHVANNSSVPRCYAFRTTKEDDDDISQLKNRIMSRMKLF